jgi:hypothetical protein
MQQAEGIDPAAAIPGKTPLLLSSVYSQSGSINYSLLSRT